MPSLLRAVLDRVRGRPHLYIPARLQRNSATVLALMPPADSGALLLEKLRARLGLASWADTTLLDFGCGVRFAQAIVNRGIPIGRYVGVDLDRELIGYLQRHVRDARCVFHRLDVRHPLYSPAAAPLVPETTLRFGRDADVVSMFSVITHQDPESARGICTMLRRHVKDDGALFFTCFLDDTIETFADRSPERNLGRCFYNPAFLVALVEACGWRFVDRAPSEGPLIGDSFVFRPSRPTTR
jgi:2-polyprenyl-3-methyl-5-hydroxy-6-metoxy-1,4-benzoquinol methylase